MALVVWIWAMGCSGASPQEWTVRRQERAAYFEAHTGTYTEGMTACSRITSEPLRRDCTMVVATRAADQHLVEEAEGACGALVEPQWKDECRFLVMDQLGSTQLADVSSCQQTGRFRDNCISHLLMRHLETELHGTDDIGREDLLSEKVFAVVWQAPLDANPTARHHLAQSLMARWIARRWSGSTFSALDCGVASKEVCALAYRSSVLPLFEGRGDRDPCGTEYSSAALEAMGGPGYTAESRPWVKRAFESLCVYRYPTPSNSPDQRWLVSGALPVMDL